MLHGCPPYACEVHARAGSIDKIDTQMEVNIDAFLTCGILQARRDQNDLEIG